MTDLKFFLDTGALIALSGLKGSDSQILKNRIKASDSGLSITHIQVDEKLRIELQDYQLKIDKALSSLKNKGIVVSLEPTKIIVLGISRFGLASFGNEEAGRVYDELRDDIKKCERKKRKPKTPLNIACDAVIAVSSLGSDFFITCDRCLFDCWHKVISNHRILGQRFKIPRVIYSEPYPKEVAKQMLRLLP
jgi:hypothetical protein